MSWFEDALGLSKTKVDKVNTGEYTGLGREFFDPNSARNRGMYNNLKNMGIDSVAQQHLGGMRMQAAGQNPFANEQYRGGLSQNLGQTQNAYNQYMQNAYNIGSGLFGYALQGNMANAQAENMARMQHSANKKDFWGGLLGNAVAAAPKFLFGG